MSIMLLLRRTTVRLLRLRNLLAFTIILMLLYLIKLVSILSPQPTLSSNMVTVRRINTLTSVDTNNYSINPELAKVTFKIELFQPNSSEKIDWHNYSQISYEELREGIGEHGEPVNVSINETELPQQMYYLHGFNTILSDKIALNRSLPDIRHPLCMKRRYLKSLPSVSVIIIFYNEHWNTLLRSIYSVLNRSPPQLIEEILLIDDGSQKESLKLNLDKYVEAYMRKVRVLHIPARIGAVAARSIGARLARGNVLVFFGSQAEANVNWLPPLLEPIALNYSVMTFPETDVIHPDTFEYRAQDEGARGAFDWELYYKRLPLLPKDQEHMPDPFESPVMEGDTFAISRAFFWKLGGYDPGLSMYGGEQLELSLKTWMCGGRILNVPCSRVGHLFSKLLVAPVENDFISKNLLRVGLVWMDVYVNFLFARLPHLRGVDPGNYQTQLMLRHKLHCKGFKWYMSQVAFDVPVKYPPELPKPFAEGRVRPLQDPKLCLVARLSNPQEPLLLAPCSNNSSPTMKTYAEQTFEFSWYKDIRSKVRNPICWDVPESAATSSILLFPCHLLGGNQEWRYYEDTKQIVHISKSCLDYNETAVAPYIMPCDKNKMTQKWVVDVVNRERLAKWEDRPVPVTGPVEYVEEVI